MTFDIKKHWNNSLFHLEIEDDIKVNSSISDNLFNSLIKKYSEKHRFYHNVDHLLFCFEILNSSFVYDSEIAFAIWYHDSIYNTKSSNNEELSAEFCKRELSKLFDIKNIMFVDNICELILTTKYIKNNNLSEKAKRLLDIDLSIFAAKNNIFDEYEQNIRKEYNWVPEKTYLEKRIEILNSFLNRESVFNTEYYKEYFESIAKENLQRSIKTLKHKLDIL